MTTRELALQAPLARQVPFDKLLLGSTQNTVVHNGLIQRATPGVVSRRLICPKGQSRIRQQYWG